MSSLLEENVWAESWARRLEQTLTGPNHTDRPAFVRQMADGGREIYCSGGRSYIEIISSSSPSKTGCHQGCLWSWRLRWSWPIPTNGDENDPVFRWELISNPQKKPQEQVLNILLHQEPGTIWSLATKYSSHWRPHCTLFLYHIEHNLITMHNAKCLLVDTHSLPLDLRAFYTKNECVVEKDISSLCSSSPNSFCKDVTYGKCIWNDDTESTEGEGEQVLLPGFTNYSSTPMQIHWAMTFGRWRRGATQMFGVL